MKQILNKIPLLICCFLLFSSCNSDEDEGDILYGISINTDILIEVTDSAGNDLLNPDFNESYDIENIKLIYVKNGVEEVQLSSSTDYPYPFSIDKYPQYNNYKMAVSLQLNLYDPSISKTIIEWNESKTDVFEATSLRSERGAMWMVKVDVNGEMKWPNTISEDSEQHVYLTHN